MLISQTVEAYTAAQREREKRFSKTRVTLLKKIGITKILLKQCMRIKVLNREYLELNRDFDPQFDAQDKMLEDAYHAWRRDPTLVAEKEQALVKYKAFINSPENTRREEIHAKIHRKMRTLRIPIAMLAPVLRRHGLPSYTPHYITASSKYLATVVKILPRYQRGLEKKAKTLAATYAKNSLCFNTLAYAVRVGNIQPQNCSICLEELISGVNTTRLLCTHIFHTECIRGWVRVAAEWPQCPICRRNISWKKALWE
jgi:hypothetical protein